MTSWFVLSRSGRRAASPRALCPEVVRPRALGRGLVVGVQQLAAVDREAAAADARRQALAEGLQGLDARVEVVAPAVRETLPVAAARGAVARQRPERAPDPLERDAGRAARLDEREPAQDGAVVAALIPVGPRGRDQAPPLVEAQGRPRDPAARRDLADRELVGWHLT